MGVFEYQETGTHQEHPDEQLKTPNLPMRWERFEWINNIFNLVQIIAEQLGLEEKNQTQTFCFNVNFKKLLNLEVFQKKRTNCFVKAT